MMMGVPRNCFLAFGKEANALDTDARSAIPALRGSAEYLEARMDGRQSRR